MKFTTHRAPRLGSSLCGLGGLLWLVIARAQVLTAAPAADQASYQDHYIDGGALVPDFEAGDAEVAATSGLARSLRIDGVFSLFNSQQSGATFNDIENGIVLRSQWETAGYGAWTLDGAARTGNSGVGIATAGQGGILTLRQRAMPFDGGWQADNSVGDINAPEVSLVRLQQRFLLPAGSMQGTSTDWRGPSAMQFVAGVGVPGLLIGTAVPSFRTLGGSMATVGGQWSPADQWIVGGQFIDAHNVRLGGHEALAATNTLAADTGLITAVWQRQGSGQVQGARAQLSLIDGSSAGHGGASGAWFDGAIVKGRTQYSFGAFRIGPDLLWGNQEIANDVQGGYFRLGYQNRRWLADFGLDAVRSVSGHGGNTSYLTADSRYQLWRDWGVGAATNVSRTNGGTSGSLEGFVDHTNAWGIGSLRGKTANAPGVRDSGMTASETWATPPGMHLSTLISIDRSSSDLLNASQQSNTALTLSVAGGGQLSTRLSLDGNVSRATALQGRGAPIVSSNLSVTWRASPAWSILANLYDSEVGAWTPLVVNSPLTPPVPTPASAQRERGVFVTFRYQQSAGMHFAPLGGSAGSGSGELTGTVYLDANDNGRRDAGEVGAANLSIVLDQRFSATTDANGRFDFPAVAAGHHRVEVVADNLPLPWAISNQKPMDVEVSTRGRTALSIAASRMH